MKVFLIFTFVVILLNSSFTYQNSLPDAVEDYINAFFTTLNGADFKMDEKCFGEDQVKQIESLIKAIRKKDTIKVIKILKDDQTFTVEHCPVKEVQDFYDQLNKAIKEGYYKTNFMNNLSPIGEIILTCFKKHFFKKISAHEAGKITAKIAKIVFYKKTE